MADPGETVMGLSIPTTELPPGLELVWESAKNLCQEMFNQSLFCVCLAAFFPALLAAERLFDAVRWCKTPHFLVRTRKILFQKNSF